MHGNSWFLREDTGGSWPRKMRRQSPWETRPRTRAPPTPGDLWGQFTPQPFLGWNAWESRVGAGGVVGGT